MNGHAPMHHQPTSPRVSTTGRGRFNPHRGGVPNFQHYHPIPPQHNVQSPAVMPSPPVSPVSSYVHPQKYGPYAPPNVPYSPSYAPQPNGPYQHVWPAQTLSPLPKQLSMLPPVMPSPPPVQPQLQQPFQQPVPVQPVEHQPSIPSFMPVQGSLEPSPQPLSQPLPPKFDAETVETKPQIQEEAPQSDVVQPPPLLAPPEPAQQSTRSVSEPSWVIWSRRPDNPSHAPGVIISPGAYPPEDIVHKALDLPTPPLSPKSGTDEVFTISVSDVPTSDEAAPEIVEVPSSSATETTSVSSQPGDTPVPGSPASSQTSVSLPGPSPTVDSEEKALAQPKAEDVDTAPAAPAQDVATPVAESAPQAATVAPPAPKPAPQKKSWASLLQSGDAGASSSKTRLPVSTVVGFSIPASAMSGAPASSAPGGPIASPHRNELLNLLNGGPGPANVPLKIQPRGLVNTGNMCFANAVLQILVYCPPFHRLFSELGRFLAGPVVGTQKEGSRATPLIDATIQFIREFVPESKADPKAKGKEREDDFYEPESFIPSYVYDAMKEKKRFASMIGGHQEDAEEFLGFYLDTLEEELTTLSSSLSAPKPQPSNLLPENDAGQPQDEGWMEVGKKNRTAVVRSNKSAESPITRIFGGKFRSTLCAPHQKDSVTVEDWRSLRLDIQREAVHSIKDALQHISHPQPVQISQPTRPGVVVEATQQALIESLPTVLVLHLKRFLYDTNVGDVVKIGKQIAFGPDLDISPDLISPTSSLRKHPVKYQLFGVLYHHGQSASGGHYTLDVLHPNRDLSDRPRQAWVRIDDELVSDIRPDDVFGGPERDDRCAYLLFYRRVGWGTPRT